MARESFEYDHKKVALITGATEQDGADLAEFLLEKGWQSRLSGPWLDRIDMQIEVPALRPSKLLPSAQERAKQAAALERRPFVGRVSTAGAASTAGA